MRRINSRPQPQQPAAEADLAAEIEAISAMSVNQLRELWRSQHGADPPHGFTKNILARALCYDLQEQRIGGLDKAARRVLAAAEKEGRAPAPRIKVGSVIVREHQGRVHEVVVLPEGYLWDGETHASLSTIARKITGVSWNGPRFFGLRGAGRRPARLPGALDPVATEVVQ